MAAEMKVEIDLNDILGDEYGAETLQESVRRQVVEQLTKTIQEGIGSQINRELSRIIDEQIAKTIAEKMPVILDDLLNAEYVAVDQWGSRQGPTTFRQQLVKAIHGEMKYVKADSDWHKNTFTKAVDSIVSENVKAFKADFDKQVNATFTQEALQYATKKLKERLGV